MAPQFRAFEVEAFSFLLDRVAPVGSCFSALLAEHARGGDIEGNCC
jgi:hypothetical protein